MAGTLAATRVGRADAARTIVMLHGMYGRGRNWQTIARTLSARRPDYACWLPDLPHHGDSGAGAHGDTIEGVAADLHTWLDAERIEPDAILGHSFGGKVALAMARSHPGRQLQIWVIDSTPETRTPSGSAWDMLATIRSLPPAFTSREQAVSALAADGWSPPVAQWMATNLIRQDDELHWKLDFDVMEQLLLSFYSTDLWDVVEHAPPSQTFHFIKASQSSAMSDEALRRVEAQPRDRVHVHHLEGGHWIHAEDPRAIVGLLEKYLDP